MIPVKNGVVTAPFDEMRPLTVRLRGGGTFTARSTLRAETE